MEDRYLYFIFWSLVWIVILNIPPGSTAIPTAYRLNFLHGVISTVGAAACLLGYIPESFTTVITLSYFIVDFINIMLNDFVWKVASYQSPQNRKVEYFHHIFCCTLGVMSEFLYTEFCTFKANPFVELMFAEFSTPFLIAWRMNGRKNDDPLGYLFVVAFFACRIAYHAGFLIPACMSHCHYSVGYGFGIPYNLMNIYFFYMIVSAFMSKPKKSKELESKESDSSLTKTD